MSEGYQKFANFMVDRDYPIFRKFRSVAIRDLLYRQAELAALDAEYIKISDRNKCMKDGQNLYDGNWEILSTAASRCEGDEQWQKALEIRGKLREYYTSVSQYGGIASKTKPRKRDVTMMLDWVKRPDLGGGLAFSGSDLCPLDNSVYQDGLYDDLMTMGNRLGESDAFTRFLAGPVFHGIERVIRYFKKPLPSDSENLLEYSDTLIIGVIDIIGTILASITPLASIIVLYFVRRTVARLAVVCVFTLLFSISLALVTKARRVEVFAATAAFASVQVVFVASTNSN